MGEPLRLLWKLLEHSSRSILRSVYWKAIDMTDQHRRWRGSGRSNTKTELIGRLNVLLSLSTNVTGLVNQLHKTFHDAKIKHLAVLDSRQKGLHQERLRVANAVNRRQCETKQTLSAMLQQLPSMVLSVRVAAGTLQLDTDPAWHASHHVTRPSVPGTRDEHAIRMRIHVVEIWPDTRTPAWRLPCSYWRTQPKDQSKSSQSVAVASSWRTPSASGGAGLAYPRHPCCVAGQHANVQADVRIDITRHCNYLFPAAQNVAMLTSTYPGFSADEQGRLLLPHACLTPHGLTLQFLPWCRDCGVYSCRFNVPKHLELALPDLQRLCWFVSGERMLAKMRLFGTLHNHNRPYFHLDHHLRRLILSFAIALDAPYLTLKQH